LVIGFSVLESEESEVCDDGSVVRWLDGLVGKCVLYHMKGGDSGESGCIEDVVDALFWFLVKCRVCPRVWRIFGFASVFASCKIV